MSRNAIVPTSIVLAPAYQEQYFTPRYTPTYKLNDLQHYMAKRLYAEMQKVFAAFPDSAFIKDLGVVLPSESPHFVREGRVLQPLTDLYYGVPVLLDSGSKYYPVLGSFYTQSVGALQFAVRGPQTTTSVFYRIAREARLRRWLFGEVLLILGPQYAEPVICVSNDKLVMYNTHVRGRLARLHPRRFAISMNGGVTLKTYTPD